MRGQSEASLPPLHSLARPLLPLSFNNAHCLRSTYPNGFSVRATQFGDVNYARCLFLDGLKRGLLLLFLFKLCLCLGTCLFGLRFAVFYCCICVSIISCKSRIVYVIFMDFCFMVYIYLLLLFTNLGVERNINFFRSLTD